jgi:hypothetical protein
LPVGDGFGIRVLALAMVGVGFGSAGSSVAVGHFVGVAELL